MRCRTRLSSPERVQPAHVSGCVHFPLKHLVVPPHGSPMLMLHAAPSASGALHVPVDVAVAGIQPRGAVQPRRPPAPTPPGAAPGTRAGKGPPGPPPPPSPPAHQPPQGAAPPP